MSSFPLRMPDHIMAQAKAASAEDHVSINQLVVAFVAEGLGHRRALRMMKDRAARADPSAVQHILDDVIPDVPAAEGDEIAEDNMVSPGMGG